MDEQILKWLDSPNVEDRKRAVKKLAQSGDRQALKYLSALYKTDPNEEVRELAVKAGRYINQQLNAAASTPATTPPQATPKDYNRNWQGPPPKDDPKPAPSDEPVYVTVSKTAEERSKGLMESAMEALVAHKTEAARKMAHQAFSLNPNLQHDAYYRSLAGEIMGMPLDAAVAELLSGSQKAKNSDKPKRKNDGSGEAREATWSDALVDLGIYGLVNAAIVIVGMVVLILLLGSAINQASAEFALSGGDPMALSAVNTMRQSLASGGVLVALIAGLIYGVIMVIVLMIGYVFTHLVATMMMGGDGTLVGLVRSWTNIASGYTVVTTLLGIVAPAIGSTVFSQQLSTATSFDQMAQATQALDTVGTINNLLILFSASLSIGMVFWYAAKIGQNYQFGTGRGCGTLIIQTVLMTIAMCSCYFILLNQLLASMSGS